MRTSPKPWPPRQRRLLLLFVAVTLLPALGLIWLGMALINQDRELADKQLRDYLDREVESIAPALATDLVPPEASASARSHTTDIGPDAIYQAAEDAEHGGRLDAAVLENQRLAKHPDRSIRAGALIRLARVLRKASRSDEALAAYHDLKDWDDVLVFDAPASLWAALSRVRELDERGRTDERDREAAAIRSDLRRGRWSLDRATLETAWTQVTLARMMSESWRERWRSAGVVVSLSDANGATVIESGSTAGPSVSRSPHETGLPWTIRVSSASPDVQLAAFGSRRRDLLLVLSLAAFLVLAGAYFVARGIRRELAVAELQSNFVSAVSHEFRTPLTSMSHLIELLRDRGGMDEARRARYYDALEQEAGRLRRFVDQLLDFGRVDAGAAQYRFERTGPRELVGRIVDHFREGPAAQGRTVAVNGADDLPDVGVDHESFALALNNLLENAAKYSPRDAPIDVDLREDAAGRRVVVRVTDRGSGIPRSEHQTIFEKFVRGAAAQTSGIRGTGVGLALAREIVRAHGGDITVDSEIGRGSTFTISLPVPADGRQAQAELV